MILTKEELAKIQRDKKFELMGEIWDTLKNYSRKLSKANLMPI
jgi:hypothetical protein